MGLGPDHFNVTINLGSLFCFQGADIGKFLQDASEPYLWVLMFKIDGEGLSQSGNYLTGKPKYFFSPGSHGNLIGEMYSGQTAPIPASVGEWDTSLQPIPISIAGTVVTKIPGLIGCCAVLMEWNLTPDAAVEAGHQALNELVQTTIEDTLASLGLAGLAADAAAEVALAAVKGKTLAIDDAVQQVLQRRLKPVTDLFTVAAPGNTLATILKNLGLDGFIGSAIASDEPMGVYVEIFTQAQLAQSYMDSKLSASGPAIIRITQHWWNMPNYAYSLHGLAYTHRVFKTVTGGPTSPRVEVSCSTKRGLASEDRRIAYIGGIDNGVRWLLTRNEAVEAIRNGEQTFFTRSTRGQEVGVIAVEGGYIYGRPWYFVQTVPDSEKGDNLLNLPDCPPAEHAVEYF